MNILTFLLFLLIAALCAVICEHMMPDHLPGGIVTGLVLGLVGAWAGVALIGSVGPSLAGVSLFSTFMGAAVLISMGNLLSKQFIG